MHEGGYSELAEQLEIEWLNANPDDVEVQRKVEEAIRQQGVIKNLALALEHSPESFARVPMPL